MGLLASKLAIEELESNGGEVFDSVDDLFNEKGRIMESRRINKYRNYPCPCGSGMKFKYCCWSGCIPIAESFREDAEQREKWLEYTGSNFRNAV